MVKILLLLLTIIRLACGQPDAGFISIRSCATSDFKDRITNITWTSDNYLVNNVGSCKTVSVPTISTFLYRKARVFGTDHRTRWCYKLPVVHGQDYLLRATFLYGPIFRSIPGTTFNFSIGSTSISSVNSSVNSLEVEGVFAAIGNSTNICLLKEKGNAYISMLELRPLNDAIYLGGNSSVVLKLIARLDIGNTNFNYRYQVDPADRHWSTQSSYSKSDILRSSNVTLHGRSSIPIEVLQSAAIGVNQLEFLQLNLDTSNDDYLIILYFLELDADVTTGQRVFDIYVNGEKKHERFDILDVGNSSNYREVPMRVRSSGHLNISLVKVSDLSIYGPICNAYEIFQVHPRSAETVESDVNAVEELRDELVGENPGNEMLQKWLGDPCVYPWEGLACEERDGGTLVVTMLNISSKNLHGPLPSSISNLTELQTLDVQNNDFKGSIPESFASLHQLLMLSIKCNPQLNGQLPPQLDTKNLSIVSGSCVEQDSSRTQAPQQTVYFIGSIAGGSVAFTVALGLIFTCFYKHTHRPNKISHLVAKNVVLSEPSFRDLSMNRTIQPFSLQVIERATNHYRTIIGEGGFGAVYRGTLPHGQEVAVKVWSATSTQGTREFDNEVNLLSNTQHENLVPLLGYCCENDQQILIYPFMSNGSLQDRLYGEAAKRKVLDWQTRLSISLGAARGLLYLHTFAGRCIIHRDVKSSNILLDHSMCGKVADFGFSKYAPQEGDSGASLEVRGTAGYLDPEYYSTQQLSTKSDVFSFGVVLLEIVTGREPLNIHRPRNEWSLLEWAKPFIRELRIEEIVDPNIKGGYHVEAMWRVVEAALACIEPFSAYRPSMEDIVRELEDALIIENNASEYMRSIESIGGSNRIMSIEPKIFSPTVTPTEASPCQIMAVLQPR